jgi:hypothetical protein
VAKDTTSFSNLKCTKSRLPKSRWSKNYESTFTRASSRCATNQSSISSLTKLSGSKS